MLQLRAYFGRTTPAGRQNVVDGTWDMFDREYLKPALGILGYTTFDALGTYASTTEQTKVLEVVVDDRAAPAAVKAVRDVTRAYARLFAQDCVFVTETKVQYAYTVGGDNADVKGTF